MSKVFLSTVLFGALFLINQEVTARELTCRGDREDCQDLLNLPIEHYEWGQETAVAAQCGGFMAACAKIMANSEGMTRCVIHTLRYPSKKIMQHEMNHCRGWSHVRDLHARPWRPTFND